MLIVLSAAVRFHAKPTTECAIRSVPRLQAKAQALAAELRCLEAKDIKKQLHVNDVLAKQYVKNLSAFEKQRPLPACCLYDSPLFNSWNVPYFDKEDAEWANRYVRVFSGLYGVLRPFDEIQPLSLPVVLGTKLTTSKGKFLRDYWRGLIEQEFDAILQNLPLPAIVNCAAEEDIDVVDREKMPEGTRIASVRFKNADKERAAESRGEFVRWALESRCMTIDELLEFRGLDADETGATYRLNPKESSADVLVFEERAGGSGSWQQKLAETGMSKAKFVKEFASGKERFKRTEFNKALAKDRRKKTVPVC